MKVVLMTAALMMLPLTCLAAIDAYEFPDKEMESRYHHLIAELRCPQCLNTNLAGSDAMIAQDLRREVHRMVLEGMSDDEILSFMHQRYGDFILYRPRFKLQTLLLWLGPVALLLLGAAIAGRRIIHKAEAVELSENESERLAKILKDKGAG